MKKKEKKKKKKKKKKWFIGLTYCPVAVPSYKAYNPGDGISNSPRCAVFSTHDLIYGIVNVGTTVNVFKLLSDGC